MSKNSEIKYKILCLIIIIVSILISSGFADDRNTLTLTGWGIPDKDTDKFTAAARDIGFDALITSSTDTAFLSKAVKAGRKYNIKKFACITPLRGLEILWNKDYPGMAVPWQIMTEGEEAASKFIMAGNNKYIIPYQIGGEPKMTNEVLTKKIICFNNKESKKLFKTLIDKIIAVPGIEGFAFDGFGYQNYHSCGCDVCKSLLAEFRKENPQMSEYESEKIYFLDILVEYINYLADYARSKNRDIKTSIHIWPVFSSEPLYGNRLNVDFCGQTAAWYTLWPEQKIAEYSRIISAEERKYHERQVGVGMTGYYDLPGKFPVKDTSRVEMELRTMIKNGFKNIQVCSSIHVINKKEITAKTKSP